ncbi:Mov34-domain-containing protein [Lentinula boryana]|uniref:Mov34-domain-containing protein n=1 Tax=Lentinula boryana TaxID=40481 RepID=A0ABQ8QN68_9AGAR|nr:Mov34-domain-containing protein [Lentinula boryana]
MFTQTWNRDHYTFSDGFPQAQRENYHPLPQPPSQPPYQPAPPPIPTESKPTLNSSPSTPEPPGGLKIVHLPRDCLNRFLTIAKVNTARNRETCGLLLGKDRGSKYVVTTLLIPKQHSTSDTCTMDEEELILQVTEERGLITLGWVSYASSCFMSSVDLHTHSAFQRMLPESFAVVCAPTSVPNFGIFRLTDPPGLGLILACNAKEAFHPHPDSPIYTDAERGHVQMKDISLEIVDIR